MNCPYCNKPAALMTSEEVYGTDYGSKVWACEPCDARVGCHQGSDEPLGTLANTELRRLRSACHKVFDPLWKSGRMTRGRSYAELQHMMQLSEEKTHIAMFNEEQCRELLATLREKDMATLTPYKMVNETLAEIARGEL